MMDTVTRTFQCWWRNLLLQEVAWHLSSFPSIPWSTDPCPLLRPSETDIWIFINSQGHHNNPYGNGKIGKHHINLPISRPYTELGQIRLILDIQPRPNRAIGWEIGAGWDRSSERDQMDWRRAFMSSSIRGISLRRFGITSISIAEFCKILHNMIG